MDTEDPQQPDRGSKKAATAQKPVLLRLPLDNHRAVAMAKKIAIEASDKVFLSKHCRQRMKSRRITITQIFNILKSSSSLVTENVYRTTAGEWKFNLQGLAGNSKPIELVIALVEVESDPSLFIVTVYVAD